MEKKTILDTLARDAFEKGGFNGTWLYAEHGEIVSKGAVGFSDLEDKVPLREDSLFDLASVSKQFTAAAVMLLRRRGLLSLEDEITRFFPEIPFKGVTVRHLLNHTGGLPDYMDWV
ncbi:MAG: beta-lactamase family protein, partial [Oscillospiraceae bacterium]|nr:beta-lactamase family protein [Oscillospiraceae bacterium]